VSWKDDASGAQDALKALQKSLKSQEKALDDLLAGHEANEVGKLVDGLAALDLEVLRRFGLAERAEAVQAGAREQVQALRQEQKRALGAALQGAAEAAGRPFRRLAENPPEFLLTPFTVVLDLERMEAALQYAREEVARVPATKDAVIGALEKAERELSAKPVAPEEQFDLLVAGWRAALALEGRPAGERVELAEVLPQVALLRQSRRFREDPQREAWASYPKVRFLYDLARLRAARLLERDGLRLDLGTATGDSTKKKGRVFWLPEADGSGQYYLTIRFVPGQRG
jgi:hypothetical protein